MTNEGLAVLQDGVEVFAAIACSPARNPFLTYVGGLDQASRSTMISAGRRVVTVLSSGSIRDPVVFPWHLVTYAVVKRLRAALREQGYSPRSTNKALTLVRNVLKEAWLQDQVDSEQYRRVCEVENLESSKLPSGRVLTKVEVDHLVAVCLAAGSALGRRDAAIVCLLAGVGLREKEVVHLLRRDYDPMTGVFEVRHGKHHKERLSYLLPGYEEPLLKFLEEVSGGPEDVILPRFSPAGKVVRPLKRITTQSVHLALAKRGEEAHLEAFTPHDLRRTFITDRLEEGVDPLRVARAVGHASPKTTMIYDRRTAESDRIAIRGEK